MGSSPSKVEEKKETSLECIGQKFTTFPSYISNYSHLRAATFSDNDLTSVKGILALKDLKQLTITHNNLTFLDEEIYFLRSLEKVSRYFSSIALTHN
jgi:Leucine-rich repeat (LRR) protein